MSELPKSEQLDKALIRGVYLTLALWKPHPEYPGSFEIGYRCNNTFHLIQFSMNPWKAWEIVKRMVDKQRNIFKIRKLLERLESK